MAGTLALSGNDSFILDGRIFRDFADGNYVETKFPNDQAVAKTGKNGNSIYSYNATGLMVETVLRLIRGSADDVYMNGRLQSQNANFAGFVLMVGEMTKKLGQGDGTITSDIYIMSGGIFKRGVDAKSNAEGDTEQSVSIYTIQFTNAPRAITK